ncbi:hypothetical protein C8Q76DRAFT_694785 [Earliella scabrosa]|nr:hypothetical protein C8Q76DRAFT_694785 [Earliella scabrosa]
MARTKQTARRSTGEKAPRMPLLGRTPSVTVDQVGAASDSDDEPLATRLSRSKKAVVQQRAPRATRQRAVSSTPGIVRESSRPTADESRVQLDHHDEAAALDKGVLATLSYTCPSCHVTADRREIAPAPYRGLYKHVDGKRIPALPTWMEVSVRGRRPQHARVNTTPLVIVHVRLATLDDRGSPARVVEAALQAYFTGSRARDLIYVDAPYNFTCVEDADGFKATTDRQLALLERYERARVLLFIYTHSEDLSGDLFYGEHAASMSLEEWFNDTICQKLQTAGQRHEVTMVLLCCGSLVAKPGKLNDLKLIGERMHVQRVLAFGAVAVQAALSVPFFIAFVHKVYIEGSRFDRTHIGELLASSVYLARHTTVVIMTRGVAGSQGTLDVADCGALSSLACTVHSKGVIVTTCRAHSLPVYGVQAAIMMLPFTRMLISTVDREMSRFHIRYIQPVMHMSSRPLIVTQSYSAASIWRDE